MSMRVVVALSILTVIIVLVLVAGYMIFGSSKQTTVYQPIDSPEVIDQTGTEPLDLTINQPTILYPVEDTESIVTPTSITTVDLFQQISANVQSNLSRSQPILKSGQSVKSVGYRYYMYLDPNGELSVYNATIQSNPVKMNSLALSGQGVPPFTLKFNPDGNIVLTDSAQKVTFQTETSGLDIERLQVDSDMVVRVYKSDNSIAYEFNPSNTSVVQTFPTAPTAQTSETSATETQASTTKTYTSPISTSKPTTSTTLTQSQMKLGASLKQDKYLASVDKSLKLFMQSDGNLVVYKDSVPIWSSKTFGVGTGPYSMKFTQRGITLFSGNTVFWATTCPGYYQQKKIQLDRLQLDSTNGLAIFDVNDNVIWSSLTATSNVLRKGESLSKGQFIKASNNKFYFGISNTAICGIFRGDTLDTSLQYKVSKSSGSSITLDTNGNLKLYSGSKVGWQTGTTTGDLLIMQDDQNLVLYDSAGKAIWASNTQIPDNLSIGQELKTGMILKSPNMPYFMIPQVDGNLVVYSDLQDGKQYSSAVWASGTNGKGKDAKLTITSASCALTTSKGIVWQYRPTEKTLDSVLLTDDGKLKFIGPSQYELGFISF